MAGAKPAPEKRPPRGPWRVHARWLRDSERYNEWVNPRDYETQEGAAEEAEREAKRRRGEGEEGPEGKKVCVWGG